MPAPRCPSAVGAISRRTPSTAMNVAAPATSAPSTAAESGSALPCP